MHGDFAKLHEPYRTSTVALITQASFCTCFFLQPNSQSRAATNAFVFSWLIQLIGCLKSLENEFQLPLLRFFARRQYKGFNSRAMRFAVESAGEGPGPGRLTDQNP